MRFKDEDFSCVTRLFILREFFIVSERAIKYEIPILMILLMPPINESFLLDLNLHRINNDKMFTFRNFAYCPDKKQAWINAST